MAQSYPLEPLLSVRRYREDAAKNAMRNAELAVQAAETLVGERQKALEDYALWRVEEENRRYNAIMGQNLDRMELEQFKAGLTALGAEEVQYAEAVNEAQKHLAEHRETLQQAREAAIRTQKETSKILMHKDIWKEGVKREAVRQEDLEMEEFKPPPPPGAESDDV